jgi:hypothetical protein
MNKTTILSLILEKLREEFETRRRVSVITREQGNNAESKAEGKYDTLAIEENYLADGLAKQAQAAADAMTVIEAMKPLKFAVNAPIDLGALVELHFPEDVEWFFMAPVAGGTEISHEGKIITVITKESPLGRQLVGLRAGEKMTASSAKITRVL